LKAAFKFILKQFEMLLELNIRSSSIR